MHTENGKIAKKPPNQFLPKCVHNELYSEAIPCCNVRTDQKLDNTECSKESKSQVIDSSHPKLIKGTEKEINYIRYLQKINKKLFQEFGK